MLQEALDLRFAGIIFERAIENVDELQTEFLEFAEGGFGSSL